jgi:hypothetical protein
LGIIVDNNFSWLLHVDYEVAKVKAATMALYPLLCIKSSFLCEANGNCIVLHPDNNDVGTCWLDLRPHCDSVGSSSATEQIAAYSDKGVVVCAK